MRHRRRAAPRPIGALLLAATLAGCGSGGPASPAWSFAAAVSPSAPAATPASVPTGAPSPQSTSAGASAAAPAPTATTATAGGLGSTCAAQWAASVTQYEGGPGQAITAFLLPRSGSDAPIVAPTALTLQTDKGPLELSGTGPAQGDDSGGMWGATRLDMGLPALKPGAYRAEFLDATDATGTWRLRVGEFVIHVLPGSPPADLVREGGDLEVGQAEGGSVAGFELDLHNTTSKPIEVTGASTDIPGLPVAWVFVEGSTQDTFKVVKSVAIPAGALAKIQVGTMGAARPVSFVLASPQVAYRVGGSAERRAVFDPVLFESGFGQPSDVTAYRDTLPPSACAQPLP